MSDTSLRRGTWIYHPKYGFGVIRDMVSHDAAAVSLGGITAEPEGYYDIQLMEGGTLMVPVARADELGLRLLTNSLKRVVDCLRSPAEDLPEKNRKRIAELQARSRSAEPTALARAVRDLVAMNPDGSLSASESKWLDQACERLSTEVALVEDMSQSEARAAIRQIVNGLGAT